MPAPSIPFQEMRAPLHRYILARVRHLEIAEDLVQDVLLRASRNLHNVRSSDTLPAWLFQIARNRIADYFRTARDTVEYHESAHAPEANPAPDYEDATLRASLATYIRTVVEGLPPLYRQALLATEYDGLTQGEYARRENLTLSAAKSRVQRARAHMRAEMERCCRWEADKYGHVLGITPRDCGCAEK